MANEHHLELTKSVLGLMRACFNAGAAFGGYHRDIFGSIPNDAQKDAGWNAYCDTTLKKAIEKTIADIDKDSELPRP